MPTKPELQKQPAPKLPKNAAAPKQAIGVVKLANGSFTKIGQLAPEARAHTEDDYLCVVRIKGLNMMGYVYTADGDKMLPTSTIVEDWQGATFKKL